MGPRGRQRHHGRARARNGSNLPLDVVVDGKAVRVLLAKGAAGELASTVADVAAALRTDSEGLIDRAHAYRTSDGTGIVQPTLAPVPLTDFLNQKRDRRARGRGAARLVHDPRPADHEAPPAAATPAS